MAAILEDMFACPIINEALSEITQETTISALSGYNTEQTEYKAPGGAINAMISIFLSDTIGIGVTEDGQIYTEVRGNDRENIVGILYHPKTKLVQACQFNPEDVSSKQTFIKPQTNHIPFQIAIPFMVHQRIVDRFKDLETAWNSLISGKDGEYFPKIPDADYAHCIIDAFVSAVESDYPVQLGKIENLALTPSKVYDYTPILLNGNEGTFRLTKSVPKPDDEDPFATGEARSFQKQMEDLREEMFPLVKEYYDALSDEDKALVPDEEKLGIYIPTKKFINIVRILADGIKRGEKDTQNVLLKGPPGCGKSTMAVAIAYVFSMPYRFTQSYKTADASEYIGTTVAENGVLKTNVATQFAQTVLRGGVHMDDDNNYAAEGEGTVKNSILIAPYTLKLADGTMAKRHPFSIFMMSANPDAKGSRPINEAYSASRS